MIPAAEDPIVAPASAPGRGAVAVVRASGAGVIAAMTAIAGGRTFLPRRATHARLALPGGILESAVVTTFVAPRSFTGQDVVEVGVHGSPVIVEALVDAFVDQGARLARAGEFSLRAYLNGKLDLLQAEAIADLVAATTPTQARLASAHLDGTLSRDVSAIGDEVAAVRALLEASLDFPDEGFHFITPDECVERLERAQRRCAALLSTADHGRRLRDGATVVVAGRPNAGKSSLFNALVGRPRAIVTDVPGTTRDLVTEVVDFGGVPVTLVDTAGVRESGDAIEREGIARAESMVASADLVLVVVDPRATIEDLEATRRLWASIDDRPRVCVITRHDLWAPDVDAIPAWCPDDVVMVSSVTLSGITALASRIGDMIGRAHWEAATLTRTRHRALVAECAEALARASATAASGGSEEYVIVDVLDALQALDQLRGVETPEQVLETIFGSFCIGK